MVKLSKHHRPSVFSFGEIRLISQSGYQLQFIHRFLLSPSRFRVTAIIAVMTRRKSFAAAGVSVLSQLRNINGSFQLIEIHTGAPLAAFPQIYPKNHYKVVYRGQRPPFPELSAESVMRWECAFARIT